MTLRLIAVLVLASTIVFWAQTSKETAKLQSYANKLIQTCKISSPSYPTGCYEQEIYKITNQLGLEKTFQVINLVAASDPAFQRCHVAAHYIASAEVKRHQENWQEVISRCPVDWCSTGCIHGTLLAHFQGNWSEQDFLLLKESLKTLCDDRTDWHPTIESRDDCFHSLGHLLMWLTHADLDRTLSLCRELVTNRNDRPDIEICYKGAFMQLFDPLEADDKELVKGKTIKKEDLSTFCSKYEDSVKTICFIGGWALYGDLVNNPQKIILFCSQPGINESGRCFFIQSRVAAENLHLDEGEISSLCQSLPKDKVNLCLAAASSELVERDPGQGNLDEKAVHLCQLSSKVDTDNLCFKELVFEANYIYKPGTSEFMKYCGRLPEPWNKRCLSGETFQPLRDRAF